MFKFKDLFISSCKEMKNVRCITLAAMFGAISIVLGFFTFMPVESIKIGWTFLPNEYVFYLFGPFVGAFYGAAMDILNYFIHPMGGPFFPGFTISAVLTGLLYGVLLYKRPLSVKRIIIVNVLRMVLIDLLLNTYWLTMLQHVPFLALLPWRVIKQLIMLPIETFLLYTLIKGVEASGILKILNRKNETVIVK